jgi:hypothetical protein
MNAQELAKRLRHCSLNDDTKFDSESGIWYDVGLLVVARPGSGKTWMMQQIVHFICEEYLTDIPYRFVPVLLSVQRIARLYRKYCVSSARKEPIKSQTGALELLEVILRWDYDDLTVDAILECYCARTLVILLDGLDEASSLANIFESFGVFLAKSGNRVVMAARPEGIKNQEFYSKREGWTLLDLPELSVEQQEKIANHQIENLDTSSFFKQFYQFQDSRNELDAAADKCLVDEDELGVILSGIKVMKMELVPKATLLTLALTLILTLTPIVILTPTLNHPNPNLTLTLTLTLTLILTLTITITITITVTITLIPTLTLTLTLILTLALTLTLILTLTITITRTLTLTPSLTLTLTRT